MKDKQDEMLHICFFFLFLSLFLSFHLYACMWCVRIWRWNMFSLIHEARPTRDGSLCSTRDGSSLSCDTSHLTSLAAAWACCSLPSSFAWRFSSSPIFFSKCCCRSAFFSSCSFTFARSCSVFESSSRSDATCFCVSLSLVWIACFSADEQRQSTER